MLNVFRLFPFGKPLKYKLLKYINFVISLFFQSTVPGYSTSTCLIKLVVSCHNCTDVIMTIFLKA